MTPQRIGLVSSCVPLVFGGGRFIVDWLALQLEARGHQVERVMVPTIDEPAHLLEQMTAFRMMELDGYFDRVITFRPPAHMVRHRRKVCWFIHHYRFFYDLWDSEYRGFPDNAQMQALRDTIHRADTAALAEAHKLFTNSRVVADRLRIFNHLAGEVLYPPVMQPDLFHCGDFGDEIVSVCRMEAHKRQHLLIEAMRHVETPVRLRLCGLASNPAYAEQLAALVHQYGLENRVSIEHRWISEEEKADRLATSLASAYIPFDEDSYGYPTLEAAHARRCTITVSDSGGVPEFVRDGVDGLIAAPEPQALAAAFDRLFTDRAGARQMGQSAARRVAELGIDWDTVIGKLLA